MNSSGREGGLGDCVQSYANAKGECIRQILYDAPVSAVGKARCHCFAGWFQVYKKSVSITVAILRPLFLAEGFTAARTFSPESDKLESGTFSAESILKTLSSLRIDARTVCADHSMAYAEKDLAKGNHDFLPVIDPATDQLIGILSMSDILQARNRAKDILRPDSGDGRSLMTRLEQERT